MGLNPSRGSIRDAAQRQKRKQNASRKPRNHRWPGRRCRQQQGERHSGRKRDQRTEEADLERQTGGKGKHERKDKTCQCNHEGRSGTERYGQVPLPREIPGLLPQCHSELK